MSLLRRDCSDDDDNTPAHDCNATADHDDDDTDCVVEMEDELCLFS